MLTIAYLGNEKSEPIKNKDLLNWSYKANLVKNPAALSL